MLLLLVLATGSNTPRIISRRGAYSTDLLTAENSSVSAKSRYGRMVSHPGPDGAGGAEVQPRNGPALYATQPVTAAKRRGLAIARRTEHQRTNRGTDRRRPRHVQAGRQGDDLHRRGIEVIGEAENGQEGVALAGMLKRHLARTECAACALARSNSRFACQ